MNVRQIKAGFHATKLFCCSLLFIFLILSCKKKEVDKLDNVEQVEKDSTSLIGKGGVYYNNDIVSTPPKEVVYKFITYKGRVGERMDPGQYVYTIGVLGYRPWLSFSLRPDNYTTMRMGLPSEEMHPVKQVREYVNAFEFYRPVNEEFTLTSTLKINALNLSVSRSTKIKIEVVERNVDVIHTNFGMSREEVKKVEKDELNVPDSEFLQVNPDLILKSLLFDPQLGATNFLAFAFKDNKLVSVTGINKYSSDLSVFDDLAKYFGYESTVSGLTPVKWQKNGLQFTVQMKEVNIGMAEKKTAPCYVIEKVP
ncbi:hypothetical protein [Dyadobacter jiangsuensis]|uniref:Uncharacterized protein n=1 Tax=Dyadobacter jiangsuensis TaxID=1591085 RepID=A0A2P8FZM8_9BACT|nr:hypothetical protein [Dyadobacter jiangsuensis]PSL27181.1 hypothetical protein CLV60_10835 [Dyadobacter jiangsuensis]